jgi:sialate O-acetylesterase
MNRSGKPDHTLKIKLLVDFMKTIRASSMDTEPVFSNFQPLLTFDTMFSKQVIKPGMSKQQHMKKTSLFLVFSVVLLFVNSAYANIRLPALISGDMVLQQRSTIALWGWAEPGEKVFITTSWNNQMDSVVTTGDANWKMQIETPAAGGPYTITLKGWNTIVLDNVMIGEVWICSGQSNMEWSSNQKLPQILEELPNSQNNNLRLFHTPKTTSLYPQDDLEGKWKVCSPESLKGFSAVGYFFGKKLQQELNVPVGLINASWGGTPAETWTPAEKVNGDAELQTASAAINKSQWWPVTPGLAYNAMIAPVTKFAIAGAIWYQGESNTGTASTYSKLLSAMIDAWRKAWQKEFPFYYVQIAPFTYGKKNEGALLREQQTRTLAFPKTGMVVITDLVDNVKDIHPQNKKDVGARLANLALGDTYGKTVGPYKYPSYQRMDIHKDKINIYFNNAESGLMTKGNAKPIEFFIAGEDRNFVPADVKVEKNRVVVSSKQVKNPVAVRFGFSNTAMPNLFNKEGLPVDPFRTDTWEVDTSSEQ